MHTSFNDSSSVICGEGENAVDDSQAWPLMSERYKDPDPMINMGQVGLLPISHQRYEHLCETACS